MGLDPCNHSCQTQLILLVIDILKAMDSYYQVDLILLDFTKAFDTVPHKRLLVKLHYYGIHGPFHDWINAWLAGRYQKVIIEGESSRDVKKFIQVFHKLQGTVLGPLMFLINVYK